MAWTAFLSPHGRIFVAPDPESSARLLDPAAAHRILRAFTAGSGAGLLHLGSAETSTQLPPVLTYWRDFGRLFMARLCTHPEIEASWRTLELPAPEDELLARMAAAPPMIGGEYLDAGVLRCLWGQTLEAARASIAAAGGDVRAWLGRCDPAWSAVGRVSFRLLENRNDEERPFAFLATYAARVGESSLVQHRPLGRALQDYAGERNRRKLEALLSPVQRAAERSEFVAGLVESGAIYQSLAWTPVEAHRFLRDVPVLEQSGVVVRVPDWWKPQRPPRPRVTVTVGGVQGKLGLNELLEFSVGLTLDGEAVGAEEWRALREGAGGLVRLKGRWVEVDREKLQGLLDGWKRMERAAARGGVSFIEGMRLLAGAEVAPAESEAPIEDRSGEWSQVVAGPWLAELLARLRRPGEAGEGADPGSGLRAVLRPYQVVGVRWLRLLSSLGLGACLADDMGLGKTVQLIGLLVLRRGERREGAERIENRKHAIGNARVRADDREFPPPSLLVVAASLIANLCRELERFAPVLRVFVAHPSVTPAVELAEEPRKRLGGADVVITTYGTLLRNPWLVEREWDVVALDEAQAIKNPSAKQTRAAKRLPARARVALTGTPVENRLSDLWSIFDFLCPGLLGGPTQFAKFVKRLEPPKGSGFAPLRELVRPYILRRLKTDRSVIADLPEKTEVRAYCPLTTVQAALYERSVAELGAVIAGKEGIRRRGVVLSFLLRFKQICNHPSQWLGDGVFAPRDSGKFERLRELCEEIAERQEKVLVFTQFRELTGPLGGFLATVFGRAGLVLHGGTTVRARAGIVDSFQADDGPPFLVVSVKAGGTGLNLTAAAHVIHFDRWWNPAVEDQATDRAFRIGQRKNVLVHKFVCRGTVEERIDALIESKRSLAGDVIAAGGEVLLTEMSDAELLRTVALDLGAATSST
ncbi:MAG: DEAD/DEAH box helicase [Deltaproteobacteria bacterium]|nr:DEAD/DEAH box helicase [Deltaproteobacteria bacterium]